MKRQQRLARLEKSRMFSQKETVELSGFSRKQLQKLEQLEIIKPRKIPAVLYSWNQIIFLRILYHFRKIWSLQQIDKAFKDSENPINAEVIIEDIDKFLNVYFGEKGVIGNLGIYIQFNEVNMSEIRFKAAYKSIVELPHIVIDDGVEIGQGKFTVLNVPKVIEELKVMAESLNVQESKLKVI
ncbi:MAG: hypothetical protein KME22_00385 [Hassallia sp. WJT32-NPBG1]|jgi:hypothetical protein|uniref:hypothetical protein n=1 Tax=Tolypothrix sp. NIES-4075 TaxID=2005459 RepID=UPI000B5CA099|nr:hypothetical protein [Tolypothrix sp. NIES-4075]MBW4605702.1 hypothetical protein [Hassallia sp. WJT32-NPBG1]GAX45899.1 hypothetical protein NIES4075_69200 [Tolypothrix sp. NIES-4075]